MTKPSIQAFNINIITQDFLDEKRKHTDPTADEVISQIINSGNEENVNDVFFKLAKNESYQPELFKDLPPEVYNAVTHYFESTAKLPPWADSKKIREGEKVFSLFGPEIFMLLNVQSLPMCYTCSKGAKVLYMTGRLSERGGNVDPLVRRLMETAQMVVNAMSPGGLAAGGRGVITLQKVRLIHAAIRYFLKHEKFNPQGWDLEVYGEPINQEDLAGTLMSFSPIILNGLEKLGVELSEDQKNAYLHCWRIIGYLMGVDAAFLPETAQDNWQLAVKILQSQSAQSDEGEELTRSCINFIDGIMPGNIFNGVSEYMIWYFSQDLSAATGIDLPATIGVTEKKETKEMVMMAISKFLSKEISHVDDHLKNIQSISAFFNKLLLQAYLKHYNGGKNIHFFIPPSLSKDWNITDEWEDKFFITPNIFGNRIAWQQKKERI